MARPVGGEVAKRIRRAAGDGRRGAKRLVAAVSSAAPGAVRRPLGTRAVVGGAAGAGLLIAVGLVAATGPWQAGQRVAERSAARTAEAALGHRPVEHRPAGHRPGGAGSGPGSDAASAPAVLAALPANGAAPAPSAVAKALAGPLGNPALGSVTATVLDARTGRLLYSRAGTTPMTPASTTKLATATAALHVLGPEHRITTRTVLGAKNTLVLVGGGDPTLTAAAAPAGAGGDADLADQPARLSDLADRTADALKRSGTTKVTLRYDLSAYTGSPYDSIGVNDNLAKQVPLMVDEGRVDPGSTENAPRFSDPAANAASRFAALLGRFGITVQGAPASGRAPAGAAALAAVQGLPTADLVEKMLTESDNDIAEALARQVALAEHADPSFAGGGAAVRRVVTSLGVPPAGLALHDGSGLDRANTIPAETLARLLALSAAPGHPELRAVATGLPVAGFTGTLDERYIGGGGGGGAGVIRAKTGSLTGVNTLAGLAPDADGRLLAFAFMSNKSFDATAARTALDKLASTVTSLR
ncbi:D-alanyl-D-alanine carboxypeptidase/D-alanyl-D-alanine-endopeptidase [Mangrovactinospora gilvigrisea]|uniref:D-alanyl-D-alanine carboxypeptidase/D-alanyl-D-alanine-endopeptidase n=1 Tax=Mangrovactinospora gilvigrisea TaxID=1428644 RepID=A0A1J7BDV5_9ACTN|nr:D-alanyl-D-alanine carboxypeptidase/D-alanyl-D-alanine-endopeptidase [Mangrovactinospora gilvigrisea]OIV36851.1 D-alanyl-D-alanine carboxypeptidase/D-alanyl-D-alanine-endopeptidase [Mangrovactinospora gilvigrisea]